MAAVTVRVIPLEEAGAIGTRKIEFTRMNYKCIIGRSSRSETTDLIATDTNLRFDNRVVSRNHSELFVDVEKNRAFIKDLCSMHGTYLNGVMLNTTPTLISNQDIVTLGSTVNRGSESFQPVKLRVEISWTDHNPQNIDTATNTFAVPDDESEPEDPFGDSEDIEYDPFLRSSPTSDLDIISIRSSVEPEEANPNPTPTRASEIDAPLLEPFLSPLMHEVKPASIVHDTAFGIGPFRPPQLIYAAQSKPSADPFKTQVCVEKVDQETKEESVDAPSTSASSTPATSLDIPAALLLEISEPKPAPALPVFFHDGKPAENLAPPSSPNMTADASVATEPPAPQTLSSSKMGPGPNTPVLAKEAAEAVLAARKSIAALNANINRMKRKFDDICTPEDPASQDSQDQVLPDAQPRISVLTQTSSHEEESEPPRKRLKAHEPAQPSSVVVLARYAATAVTGAIVGGMGAVLALAFLPPNYFE